LGKTKNFEHWRKVGLVEIFNTVVRISFRFFFLRRLHLRKVTKELRE